MNLKAFRICSKSDLICDLTFGRKFPIAVWNVYQATTTPRSQVWPPPVLAIEWIRVEVTIVCWSNDLRFRPSHSRGFSQFSLSKTGFYVPKTSENFKRPRCKEVGICNIWKFARFSLLYNLDLYSLGRFCYQGWMEECFQVVSVFQNEKLLS
jgi:hypothetical protein